MESPKLIHEGFLSYHLRRFRIHRSPARKGAHRDCAVAVGLHRFGEAVGLLVLESPRMSLWASLFAASQAAAVLPGCTDGIEGFSFQRKRQQPF